MPLCVELNLRILKLYLKKHLAFLSRKLAQNGYVYNQ